MLYDIYDLRVFGLSILPSSWSPARVKWGSEQRSDASLGRVAPGCSWLQLVNTGSRYYKLYLFRISLRYREKRYGTRNSKQNRGPGRDFLWKSSVLAPIWEVFFVWNHCKSMKNEKWRHESMRLVGRPEMDVHKVSIRTSNIPGRLCFWRSRAHQNAAREPVYRYTR